MKPVPRSEHRVSLTVLIFRRLVGQIGVWGGAVWQGMHRVVIALRIGLSVHASVCLVHRSVSNPSPCWTQEGAAVLSLQMLQVRGPTTERPGHVSAVTQLMSACWGGTWFVCLSVTIAWALLLLLLLLLGEQRFVQGAQRCCGRASAWL